MNADQRRKLRILVIGSSCAGKTTFAKALAAKLDIPHIQLDAINWLPGWVERKPEDFRQMVTSGITENQEWVLDGNYSRIRDITWPKANQVIWLNFSFPIVFWRSGREP